MYVPAGRTVTVNGVHFRNGNGATAAEIVGDDYYMSGGGVLVKGSLTLKNLDITRCQGGADDSAGYGGGVAAIEASGLVLNDVNITQCSGYTGGAIYARKTPLTYTGAAGAKAKLHYNYGYSYTGAIESYSEFGATRSGETTVTLQHLDARYNHCPDSGPGAIGIVDYLGYVSAEITDVEVIENSAYYAGGMWLEIGKADGDPATYPGKATLTNVSITGNACTESNSQAYGGGLLNLGRLHLGTGVVISGNMSNYGSGVLNLVATANVTCAAQAVSGNKSFTNVAAANGQTWADCYGGGNGSYSGQKMENRMPLACCATHYPCSVICGGVCCASGGSCNGTACP